MGRMHIDHNHSGTALGKNVNAMQLSNGIPQRWLFATVGRSRLIRWHYCCTTKRCGLLPGADATTTEGLIKRHLITGSPLLLRCSLPSRSEERRVGKELRYWCGTSE